MVHKSTSLPNPEVFILECVGEEFFQSHTENPNSLWLLDPALPCISLCSDMYSLWHRSAWPSKEVRRPGPQFPCSPFESVFHMAVELASTMTVCSDVSTP